MTSTQAMAPSQPLPRKPEALKEDDGWCWDLAAAHLSPTAVAPQKLLHTAGKRECRPALSWVDLTHSLYQ